MTPTEEAYNLGLSTVVRILRKFADVMPPSTAAPPDVLRLVAEAIELELMIRDPAAEGGA